MTKPIKSFVGYRNGLATQLRTKVKIAEPFDASKMKATDFTPDFLKKYREYVCIWDTGASSTVISPRVVNDCKLTPIDIIPVGTGGGVRQANVYLTSILLPNHFLIGENRVSELPIEGFDVLIGMDIISQGDFAISNLNGKTVFTFRIPSQQIFDFTKPETYIRTIPKKKPNDPCSCGSGKKYKKCCGA